VAAVARPTTPVLLALRALWLGDLLAAVPALRALADAFPDHRRLLAMPAALAPLAELADTGFEVVDAAPLAPLPSACAGAELAVNLHGRGPQSHRVLLATRPRRLIAFRHPEFPAAKAPKWRADEHEVRRWCRLLTANGISADPARLRIRRPTGEPGWEGATIVHAGAKARARRWPPARWAAVAKAEAAAGRKVALTGSSGEAALAREVARLAGLGPDAVLAGATDVARLAALVANAGRLVSGDTGVAHLATAFGTPSVTLFGPVGPASWGPLVDPSLHHALWKGPRSPAENGAPDPALLEITVEEVLAALGRLPLPAAAPAATLAVGRAAGAAGALERAVVVPPDHEPVVDAARGRA
jgi:ADP-heptose:LPS heptosyltransferase